MRLQSVRQEDVFVADDDYVYERVVATKDAVNIRFMFIADAVTLLDQGITIVDVEGYRSKPVFRSEFGKRVDSLQAASAQDAVNVQGNFDFQNSNKIFDKKVDITALIDNNEVRNLRLGVGRTFDYIEAVEPGSETVAIDEFIVSAPPIARPPISVKNATIKMIAANIDPASYIGKFPVPQPQTACAIEKVQDEIRFGSDFTTSRPFQDLRRSTTRTRSSSNRYRRITATSRFVPVKFEAQIPLSDAEEEDVLYLVIRANLPNGKLLSRYVYQAPSIRDVLDNPRARSIRGYLATVKTIARSVQVLGYRASPNQLRTIARTFRGEPRNDTYYTELDNDLYTRRIPGTRIERRVGKNPFYGGFAFSSRVFRNRSNNVDISLRNGSKLDADDVTFQIYRVGDNLQVKVIRLASDIVECIALRRNITRNEESFSHLSTDASISRSTSRNPVFIDSTCEPGHDYEYAIGLIDKFGSLEVSEIKQRYTYLRKQEGVSLRIGNVSSRLERSGGSSTRIISFSLFPKQAGKGTQRGIRQLKSNSIPTDSIADTIKSPDSYDPIFYFEITREELETGVIERCGIFTNRDFVDDSAKPGSELPVTPLKPFSSYRYNIKLGLESAAALIPTQYSLAISRDGKKYPLHSYKFKKNDRINSSLPSEQELQGVTSTLFSLIDTGVETSIKITGTRQTLAVQSVSVTRNVGGFNVVRWDVRGEEGIVDHYRVYAAADGIECLLGCTVPVRGNNVFYDSELFDRVGLVTYRVAPVLLDFSEANSASATIFTLRNEPDFIIERAD